MILLCNRVHELYIIKISVESRALLLCYDLEEVERIKGEYRPKYDIKIDLNEPAYIPKEYIEEFEKITIYKRAVEMTELQDIRNLFDEIEDRFGKAPQEVKNLFRFLEIKETILILWRVMTSHTKSMMIKSC